MINPKNMRINLILGLYFCFFWVACQPAAFLLYGIKKPRQVSTEKIEKKAKKLGLDTFGLYSVRVQHYPNLLNEVKSLPNIRIYDKAGNLYNYRQNPKGCNWAFNFIKNLGSDSTYACINDSSFYKLPFQLEGLHGQPFDTKALPDADYYVFIFWGTFLGKLNQRDVIPCVEQAKNNSHAKIQIIPVSIDLRRHWGADYLKYWEAYNNPPYSSNPGKKNL